MIEVTLLGALVALIVVEACVSLGVFLWEEATNNICGKGSIISIIAIIITAVITYAVGFSPIADLILFTI